MGSTSGKKLAANSLHLLEVIFRIDQYAFDVAGYQVAQNADGQREILMYQAFYRSVAALKLNDRPQLAQKLQIGA